MNWLEIKITTQSAYAERISLLLLELGALAITYQDAEDQAIFEPKPGEMQLWQQVVLTGLFEQNTQPEDIIPKIQTNELWPAINQCKNNQLADEDWERAWLKNFQPIKFAENLWVCPSWTTPPDPQATNIILDPGLAFGTGTHETTYLCLEWLANQTLTDQTLLDFGCGSGILSIAAAKLGASQIQAVDIDPQALQATRANALKNQIAAQQLLTLLPNQYQATPQDILIANILIGPLKELALLFAQSVKPNGKIALSGLLVEQESEITQTYEKWFHINYSKQKNDWILLSGYRKS